MKKCILSVLGGAAAMFLLLVLIANSHHAKTIEEYEHIDFKSTITPSDCFVWDLTGARTMWVSLI